VWAFLCPQMSVDILGTSCDQCRSMVQYSFTSKDTRRLVRTDSPGRPPRLSHSSWTMDAAGLLYCCFTSTEARWLIRDGDRVGRGRQSEGSTAETARKRPERPWTAARTMEVLRRCPLAIAQRLVHCAIAVSAVLGQSQRQCPLHCCWWTTWTTRSKKGPTCSAQHRLTSHDFFWANLKVQLHLPPLRSFDLAWNIGRGRARRTSFNIF